MMMHKKILALTLGLLALGTAAGAQTVTVRAGTQYDQSPFWRALFGDTWRDVWAAQFEAPVLDLRTYKGGLEPFKRGGNQTKTLRMHGGDGRVYIFRSTDKNIEKALPDDLSNTPIGDVIQDQTSSFHPSAGVVVGELQEALGLLHARPTIVVMPDDERLGEYRDDFKNLLGTIEERPDEAEKGKTFGDADDIDGTDTLLENLEESSKHQLDSRDYLKVRLLDFIIGDTDRGADQLRWAQYKSDDGSLYRPIPRDRDYAFMHTEGLLMSLASKAYPKLTRFRPEFPKLNTLVFMTREFDRSHLVSLPRETWDTVVAEVQNALTNAVIDRAVALMPEPHRQLSAAEIATSLRARRDALPGIAAQFYTMVNQDADIFLSDDDERADIERLNDGRVRVQLFREKREAAFFDRTFDPADTDEIRVHLERGNDQALVHGDAERSIELRVIGGEGDDVLVDSSRVAHGDKTHFYDASGNNRIVSGANTSVATGRYDILPPERSLDEEENQEPEENPRVLSEERRGRTQDLMPSHGDYVASRMRAEATRTWGKVSAWGPLLAFREGNGLVLGFGPTITDYGFRRRPFESQIAVRGMVGTSGRVGVQLEAQRYFEMSPWSISLFAHATQLEVNRVFGVGNDTPLGDVSASLLRRDELLAQPAVNLQLGDAGMLSVGPVVRHVKFDGGSSFTDAGVRADLALSKAQRGQKQQRGLDVTLGASAMFGDRPTPENTESNAFAEGHALAELFVPVGSATLALRAGGKAVDGSWSVVDGAFIGGRETLRGFRYNRFLGDASAFGAAELRVPITRITLLTRGDLGVLAFSDAGRVWFNGESVGDWHTSTGAGLWFGSLGQAVSLTYAKGEEGRLYLTFGLPF